MTMAEPLIHNTDKWIEENSKYFLPPICNKMMHTDQMKCFFVGGPNVRKDYHLEEGPEFFYMVKGDMCLKIIEQNKPKDVVIKEGEVFMLPPRFQHSPQRKEGTIGLVIERERLPNEMDALRYFVEKDDVPTNEVLFERWFHCENLGPQLAAVINEFFDSEQHRTGVPLPGTILGEEEVPFKVDTETAVLPPFSLQQWLTDNKERIEEKGSADLFSSPLPAGTEVKIYGKGEVKANIKDAEIFFWVFSGSGVVTDEGCGKNYPIEIKDTLWLPKNTSFKLKVEDTSTRVLAVYMAPPS